MQDDDHSEDENAHEDENDADNQEGFGYYRTHPEPNQGHPAFQNQPSHPSNENQPSNGNNSQAQPYVPLHGPFG